MNIQFFTEDIDFNINHKSEITHWIQSIAKQHSFTIKELNYIFCSDEYLLAINKEHLDHDYYTDIITFDNSEEEKEIESDIFISIDRVQDNANKEGQAFDHELSRVMIHGVLHLIGFDDKTSADKDLMREKEDACLSLLKI